MALLATGQTLLVLLIGADFLRRFWSGVKSGLSILLFGNRQVEFREDFFHVFPDPSAIVRGVISQEVCGVICGHKLYGRTAEAGVVVVELTSKLANGFVCI